MTNLARRRGGLDVVDTAVGVGVGLIAAVFVLKILGWVLGTVFFLVKIAVVAVLIAAVIKVWSMFRGDRNRY